MPSRAQNDALLGEHGAFFVASAETVAEKIMRLDSELGGLSRFTVQMTNVIMAPAVMLQAVELLGTEVKPRTAPRRPKG